MAASSEGDRHSVNMDVDMVMPFAGCKGNLKRSNSAPMINALDIDNCNDREEIYIQPLFEPQPRARRFSSGGFAPIGSPSSPHHLKTPSRISQIKQEEGMDVANREAAHEKEVRSTLQMSQSCEDLTLITLSEPHTFNGAETSKRPRCFTEPLHIFPSVYPLSSSPSPTRLGKQCFSPSMQQAVRNTSFCTSPVLSPTRKSVSRRSLSPIALRPSQFPMKRKYESGDRMDCNSSPQKRFHGNARTVNLHPLAHSLSSNSLDGSSSPGDQAVPMSSANTPDSVSSRSGSPFKPVDTSADSLMMQDSESEACASVSTTMPPLSIGNNRENSLA